MPIAGIVVEGHPALNRVSWSQSGQYVTAGDDLGRIWVYEVGEVSVVCKIKASWLHIP